MCLRMRRRTLSPELNMPLVNVSVFDASCSRLLISWTVFCIQDERMTLESLFEMVVARSEASVQEHLNDHHDESRVGDTMVTQKMCWTVWETQVSHLSFHLRRILKCYLLPRLLAQCVGIHLIIV